jgi:structural protein KPP10_ORF10
MTQRLALYDADQVTVSINGIPISGYADGEFLSIEPEADNFSDVVGSDGEVARSKTNDRRATVTLTLLQTSASNALLSALANLDKAAPGGLGVGALLVRDRQGTAIFSAAECWISKEPTRGFGREAGPREWTLRCANLIAFDGSA